MVSIEGDWYVVTAWFGVMVPVPAGWATLATNQEGTFLVFSEEGDPRTKDPDAQVVVSSAAAGGDESARVQGILEEWIDFVEWVGAEITEVEDFGDVTGYLAGTLSPGFLEGEGEASYYACTSIFCGEAPEGVRFVVAISEDPSEEPDFLAEVFLITAAAPAEDWDRCYPVFQHIVANWANSEGTSLSVNLPNALSF